MVDKGWLILKYLENQLLLLQWQGRLLDFWLDIICIYILKTLSWVQENVS